MALRLAGLVFIVGLVLIITAPANANHNEFLPLTPGTPLMQQIIRNQEYTYCLDARASNYPNFRSQLEDVNNQYAERTGIRSREVAFGDPSCMLKHTMPENHGCGSGCAAWVFYANWPVVIEYKWQLGYTDWRSTHGHELGHALLGLHEMYNDSSGSIGCTRRQDTVMDCGSFVRYPQSIDVSRGCSIIKTGWCGRPATEPRFIAPDGWQYEFSTGTWYDSRGVARFGPCNADMLRLDLLDGHWWRIPGQNLGFDYDYGRFVIPPAC